MDKFKQAIGTYIQDTNPINLYQAWSGLEYFSISADVVNFVWYQTRTQDTIVPVRLALNDAFSKHGRDVL